MAPGAGRLTGIGAYRPGGLLTSAELDTRFGHESGYIEQITGIRTRLKADPDDTFVEMAAQAADKALAHAGLLAGDLDCVVFSSASSVGRVTAGPPSSPTASAPTGPAVSTSTAAAPGSVTGSPWPADSSRHSRPGRSWSSPPSG
ncbi:hypothetical protein SFUMM280S_02851 [Streptomyces fumanus]